jgi:hypothetical protein
MNTQTAPWKLQQAAKPLASDIDMLGYIRAEIAKLKKEEDDLTKKIKALGKGEYAGTKCRAVVSCVDSLRFDGVAFRAANPAAAEPYMVPQTTWKLEIKALV